MKMKNYLSVRPVRKTKKPGYPSWQEPNPLEKTYSQPYPFTQKAINWLAASGLCGALFLMPEADGGIAEQTDKMEAMDRDTLGNPFPFEKMGLPHITSSHGTGLPRRLNTEYARRMIDSLFAANGFKLEKRILEIGDGLLEVDGYDKANKIGYIFLPAYRLDSSLYISWQDYNWDTKKPFKSQRFEEKIIEECRCSIGYLYHRYEGRYRNTKDQSGFINFLKDLIEKKDYTWKDEYRFMFYEFLLRDMMPIGAYSRLPYKLRLFYDNILVMPAGEARQIELDKAMSVQDALSLRDDWALDALLMAAKHDDYRTRISEFKTMQYAFATSKNINPEQAEFLKKVLLNGGPDWEQALETSKRWLDEFKANKDEIMTLENEAETGKRYVAVISEFRIRPNIEIDDSWWSRAFKEYKHQYPHADSTEFVKSLEDDPEPPFFKYAKEAAMAELEKQVHDYIRWAKQQRGY